MKNCFRIMAVTFLLALAVQGAAYAVQPDEMLSDPVLEQRARVISRDLRCMVCQNQSIDDSNADLARDLRILLRQRLKAGDTDEQVKQFMVNRYGDYVLLNPPFKATTFLLWLGPFIFLLFAGYLAMPLYRRRNNQEVVPLPLSEEEQRRVTVLLEQGAKKL